MKSGVLGAVFTIIIGLALLTLLTIPQLSLYPAYPLIVTALLALLGMVLLLRDSLFWAALFVIVMPLYAYIMEFEEGVMVASDIVGALSALIVIHRLPWPLPAKVAVGCALCAAALVVGSAWLPVLRKGMTLPEALRYGCAHQWPVFVAILAGAFSGTWLFKRKAA